MTRECKRGGHAGGTGWHRRATRRTVVGSAAVAIALAAVRSGSRASVTDRGLNFMVIGDWGARDSRGQHSVAAEMTLVARQIAPHFVISVGDNFYRKGVGSIRDPQWQESFEQIYSDPALMCPWYAVLGNHDHLGNVAAETEYSKVDSRWHMPAPFYSMAEVLSDGSAADFFFLDTTAIVGYRGIPAGDAPQLAWLRRKLAASRAQWKIVVGHHPVFSGGKHGGDPILREAVKPLFDRFGVSAYLSGHEHDLQHIVIDAVHYLISGSGSKTRRSGRIDGTRFAASSLGFMTASLAPAAMTIEFIDEAGTRLHEATIPARA